MLLYRKVKVLLNAIIGYLIKWKYDLMGYVPNDKNKTASKRIIVSLTSYGRRVKNEVVYYTLLSLLYQTIRPFKIILWLDKSWNDDVLPQRLKSLREYGVDIRYCDDIKSYKKLIPALREYPDEIIVTVDDDMIYHSKLLEKLLSSYERDGYIQCTKASFPKKNDKNIFAPYNEWVPVKEQNDCDMIVPIGVGGILYPPHSLSDDVLNENAFMKYAANADDLWFWVMALRNGSRHTLVNLGGHNYSFDSLYQFFHKGSALTHANSGESKNDVQLRNILMHYPIYE